MLNTFCNYLRVSSPVLGLMFVVSMGAIAASQTAAYAEPLAQPAESSLLDQINQYNEATNALDQVTSVAQLRDVQPTDWAYQALQSLVERYGCIEGYPDRTYRGNRALTRYEFAAGLNACLNVINELIAAAITDLPNRDDIATIQRLQQEFGAELATLRGRVDALEARTAQLEANQFSVTTKLDGEVIFALTGVAAGQNAYGGDIDNVAAFGQRTRLNLETSFTGRDRLLTRLQSRNLSAFSATSTFTPEGDLSFAAGPFQTADGDIELDALVYAFPLTRSTQVVIGANAMAADDFASTVNPYFDGDGAFGALSRFGTRPSIYYLMDGAGIGIRQQLGNSLELSLGYLASAANIPNRGLGLADGPYGAMAQLLFKPGDRFQLGLTYVNSYNTDLTTGSRVANLRTFLGSLAGSQFEGTADLQLVGAELPTSSNSYGAAFSWQLARHFVIGGWAGYTNTRTLSTLGGIIPRGKLDIFNGAVTVALPDLGRRGNVIGLLFGIEPIADASANLSNALNNLGVGGDDDDVSYHIEAFYQIQVTDNITITPGVIWLTAPDHNANNDDIFIGTIRTTFSF